MFIFLSFAIFLVAVFAIAWYKAKGTDNTETATGYFLAGRGLSGPVIAATMILTNLSTEQIIGLNGQSYATNMGPMAWEVTSCVALITLSDFWYIRFIRNKYIPSCSINWIFIRGSRCYIYSSWRYETSSIL